MILEPTRSRGECGGSFEDTVRFHRNGKSTMSGCIPIITGEIPSEAFKQRARLVSKIL